MDKSYSDWPEELINVEDKRWLVNAIWLGEGYQGDYDWNNPEDAPLMRFDVIDKTADKGSDNRCPWSYCTTVIANDIDACKRFIVKVLNILQQNEHPKFELECLTWWNGNAEKA